MAVQALEQITELRRELDFMRERENLLLQIDSATRNATDPVEITYEAARLLGRHLNVNRCAYAAVGPDENNLEVIGNFNHGLPSMIGHYTLRQFSSSAYELLTAGRPFIVEDSEADPRCAAGIETFRSTGVRATISYPLMKEGRLTAILAVHTIRPRQWHAQEVSLVALVAARCWESLERGHILRTLEADREELRRQSMESERQLAELKTIYDTAPIGLAYFDLDDYHYLRLNERQADFFGLTPDQVVGKTLTQMAPITGLRELFDQVARGEPVVNHSLEGTLVTDPADYRYWTVSYFPVHGSDGEVQGITAASQEITKQRKAEKALFETEKLAAVGRLAATISHEINNPLEAITNLLYLATASNDLEQVRKLLNTADAELRRVSAITSQTLRFYRGANNPQAVNTTDLVNETLNVYHGRLHNSSRISVSTRLRARHTIQCFDGEIRQVLANLIANALDAMNSHHGKLFIRTQEATQWRTRETGIRFTIADTGDGMAVETIKRIFDAFFTTKGSTGTGLGLWISKEIVARHRGTVRLRSSRSLKHHGTVFTIFLPFHAETR